MLVERTFRMQAATTSTPAIRTQAREQPAGLLRAPLWKRWLHSQTAAPIGSSVAVARRYHFGSGGIAYSITTLVLIIGAVNGQNNLLFVVFGSAVAGMLISGIVSGWSMMGLRITREAPGTMRVGERASLRYGVENKARFTPACGLLIEELGKASSAVGFEFAASVEQGLGKARGSLARVAAGGKEVAECSVVPRQRGKYTLTPMRISSAFPIGLTRKSVTFVQQDAVLIWPARVKIAIPPGATAPTGDERGSGIASRAGAEFFSLREYQEGDSPRSIAWRASARAATPIVRTFVTPPGTRTWIVLDLASLNTAAVSGGETLAQEELIALAAGCTEFLLTQGHEVGIRNASGEVLVPLCRGLGSLHSVLDTLALLDASKHSEPADASNLPKGSMVWLCGTAPSAPPPSHSTVLSLQDAKVRDALRESPAILAGDAAGTGPLGLPAGWFESLLAEVRDWFKELFVPKNTQQAATSNSSVNPGSSRQASSKQSRSKQGGAT
jgi:uncharacterized protein (DUF58 family)